MKKRIPFLLIGALLLSAGLVGCNRYPSFEDRVVQQEQEAMQGTIEIKELNLYDVGTHQIRMMDDSTFPIQSKNINLSNYLGERVEIRGIVETSRINEDQKVLTVEEIDLLGDEGVEEEYDNPIDGFSFLYPASWSISEGADEIVFRISGQKRARIDIFSLDGTVDEFVEIAEEGEEGTPVTVGAQRSIRFVDNDSIRIYVPNYSKKKIYLISYQKQEDDDDEEEKFFELLESFTVQFSRTPTTGKRCGGPAKLECDEGFRCELNSTEEDAAGVCVDVTAEGELACPFVPVPEDCDVYQVKTYSKDGCPTTYECLDEESDENQEAGENSEGEGESVKATFDKYKFTILEDFSVEISDMKVDEERKELMVDYSDDEGTYSVTFGYTPSGNEFNFVEKSRKTVGEAPAETESEPKEENEEEEPADEPSEDATSETIPSDFRTYENTHRSFSVSYHKNWYFRSFGPEGGSIWSVGFAKDELEDFSDSLVTVEILEGEAESENTQTAANTYFIQVPRDDESHFLVKGPKEMSDLLDTMADSIEF